MGLQNTVAKSKMAKATSYIIHYIAAVQGCRVITMIFFFLKLFSTSQKCIFCLTENLPEREMHLPDGATNNIDDDVDNDIDKELVSHKTATAVELERARALSEEARKVLNDLQLGRCNLVISNTKFHLFN